MALFGEDFRKARHNWLYQARNSQPLWFALLAFALLFVINMILQAVAAVSIAPFMDGGITDPHALVKGTIIGMLPVAVVTALACYGLASVMAGHARTSTALRWPHLGLLGWLAVSLGFLIVMYAVIMAIVAGFNVDLAQYTPGANGESPDTGTAVYDFGHAGCEWVSLGAPLAEEFMFRGPLFASLAQTPLGRWGTVLLTSAGWAGMHLTEPYFSIAFIFVMGLVLGALLLRFGSLWVTIACHGVWNLLFSVITLGIAGQS